jgi:hypothetical protein
MLEESPPYFRCNYMALYSLLTADLRKLIQCIQCNFQTIRVCMLEDSADSGYTQWTGFRTTAEQILELFKGLQQSGLDNFQYLLTGYLPNAASVSAIGTIAQCLKEKDPNIIWSKTPLTRLTSFGPGHGRRWRIVRFRRRCSDIQIDHPVCRHYPPQSIRGGDAL